MSAPVTMHRGSAKDGDQTSVLTKDYLANLSGLETVPFRGGRSVGRNRRGAGLSRTLSLRNAKPRTPRSAIRERIKTRKDTTLHIHVRTVERLHPSGQLDRQYKNENEACEDNGLSLVQLKRIMATGELHNGKRFAIDNPAWEAMVVPQDRPSRCFDLLWLFFGCAPSSREGREREWQSSNDNESSNCSMHSGTEHGGTESDNESNSDSESEEDDDDDDDMVNGGWSLINRQRMIVPAQKENGGWSLVQRRRDLASSTRRSTSPFGDTSDDDDVEEEYERDVDDTSDDGEVEEKDEEDMDLKVEPPPKPKTINEKTLNERTSHSGLSGRTIVAAPPPSVHFSGEATRGGRGRGGSGGRGSKRGGGKGERGGRPLRPQPPSLSPPPRGGGRGLSRPGRTPSASPPLVTGAAARGGRARAPTSPPKSGASRSSRKPATWKRPEGGPGGLMPSPRRHERYASPGMATALRPSQPLGLPSRQAERRSTSPGMDRAPSAAPSVASSRGRSRFSDCDDQSDNDSDDTYSDSNSGSEEGDKEDQARNQFLPGPHYGRRPPKPPPAPLRATTTRAGSG